MRSFLASIAIPTDAQWLRGARYVLLVFLFSFFASSQKAHADLTALLGIDEGVKAFQCSALLPNYNIFKHASVTLVAVGKERVVRFYSNLEYASELSLLLNRKPSTPPYTEAEQGALRAWGNVMRWGSIPNMPDGDVLFATGYVYATVIRSAFPDELTASAEWAATLDDDGTTWDMQRLQRLRNHLQYNFFVSSGCKELLPDGIELPEWPQ